MSSVRFGNRADVDWLPRRPSGVSNVNGCDSQPAAKPPEWKDRIVMRYQAVALDFDGTLAHDGHVRSDVIEALARLRDSGRRLIVVTGRELPDLLRLLPRPELFHRIVAEDGGLLYDPETGDERPLAAAPPPELVSMLRERGVAPLSVGRVVIATWDPHQHSVLESIHVLGLQHRITFNKGAVMVLPPGVNKGSGLASALRELSLSPRNTVAVGDAENDHAMFDLAERSVAVMNALPAAKHNADLVTNGDHGAGVLEVVQSLLTDDMASWRPSTERRPILLGKNPAGDALSTAGPAQQILIVGPPRIGKSTVTAGILERFIDGGYQCCVIDPEGDYESLTAAVAIGDVERPPVLSEIVQVLEHPDQSVVVNMLGVPYDERPAFFQHLIYQIQELRHLTGRPHWLIADEAHHLMPSALESEVTLARAHQGTVLVTVDPTHLPTAILQSTDIVIALGPTAELTVRHIAAVTESEAPELPVVDDSDSQAMVWFRTGNGSVAPMLVWPPRIQHRRHRRKYAQGDLGPARSFYFCGPDRHCNLRAANLIEFMAIADQLDAASWRFHLDKGDYTRWFRDVIGDNELVYEVERLEEQSDIPAAELRTQLREAIERRYTLPV